jgi:hypothetical protein
MYVGVPIYWTEKGKVQLLVWLIPTYKKVNFSFIELPLLFSAKLRPEHRAKLTQGNYANRWQIN